jgi:hypothetical protein
MWYDMGTVSSSGEQCRPKVPTLEYIFNLATQIVPTEQRLARPRLLNALRKWHLLRHRPALEDAELICGVAGSVASQTRTRMHCCLYPRSKELPRASWKVELRPPARDLFAGTWLRLVSTASPDDVSSDMSIPGCQIL